MKKKVKEVIKPDCLDCKYRTIDEKWGYSKCKLKDNPGIKFGYDNSGRRCVYCCRFAKKGK